VLPVVSVILPAYNASTSIAAAVASVRAQTFADWELIIVDDGSTDETGEIVRAAANDDPRIRIERIAHGGVVAAHNAGLALAAGRFVARMDADDEMFPDRLQEQVVLLERRADLGCVSCLVAFGGDPERARGYALHVDWLNELHEPDDISRCRFIESPVANPSTMVRREVLERWGSYRESDWPEDYEFWLRLLDAGVRIAKVPRILMQWNDPPGRLSRTDERYSDRAFYAVKCHYLARWLVRHVPGERNVWLWGAGRITRQRFAALADGGVRLAGFIDIDERKTGRAIDGVPVIAPDQIPLRDECFVLGGVGVRGARDLIRANLARRGFREGVDFVMAA